MEKIIENLLITRYNIIKLTDEVSTESINKIPQGFSNNLIWNMGHVMVTFQLLVYGLSGLKMYVSDTDITCFRKGTKPTSILSPEEVDSIKSQLIAHINFLKQDLKDNRFEHFQSYETSYGVRLFSVKDAIEFIGLHEAMHLGSMVAIKKFL